MFAIVAYNDRMYRSWRAKADLTDTDPVDVQPGGPALPSTAMTETVPARPPSTSAAWLPGLPKAMR